MQRKMGIPGRIEDAWDALMGKDRLRALKCAVYMHTSDTRDQRVIRWWRVIAIELLHHALAIASTLIGVAIAIAMLSH